MSLMGWIILGVIALMLLTIMGIYNRLVRLRALVKEGFSGITVQLRRRADLIPNLVETWDPLESTCRHASLSIL